LLKNVEILCQGTFKQQIIRLGIHSPDKHCY